MNSNYYVSNDMSELWYYMYKNLVKNGELVESRIGNTKHITDFTFCLEDPTKCVVYNKLRRVSWKYAVAELLWYFSGSNKIDFIGKYAKMWNSLTDDGETVNSAYGYRIFTKFGFNQLDYVINKLKLNKQDRQAVIHIKDADDKPTKDTPCTCLLQFIVMNDKLNCHTYMRSNDIWFGTPYDVIFFCMLQQIVSIKTGIPLGKYYHTVGDLHIYEKDIYENYENSLCYASPFVIENKDYSVYLDSMKEYLLNKKETENLPKFVIDLRDVSEMGKKYERK